MTHDTYSPTYWKPFAIYDHDTQSLKTFEDTLISDLTPFSATLPQSGMMRNGVLFELPKSERLTNGQGSTLLRTPVASESSGGIVPYDKAKENGNQISLTAQIQKFLPTPVARDFKGDSGWKDNVSAVVRMLPTPTVGDSKSDKMSEGYGDNLRATAQKSMDWSQFEPAIRRWEAVTGREAPVPLIEEKLNPEFTEWMMGLPEGWITDLDLSWTQQIKACGNGVVPQAAAEALSRLT